MPRQQSSQTKSTSSSLQTRPSVYAPPPKIWYSSPPTISQPSIWQSMKQGFGLGAGSEVGHRVMSSFLGPSSQSMPPPMPSPTQPYYASDNYIQCVQVNRESPEVCKPFLSKDKSPWTLCMEENFFDAKRCTNNPEAK